jgi:hypothetical protein
VVRSATDMVAGKKISLEKNQIEKKREWRRVLRENSEQWWRKTEGEGF